MRSIEELITAIGRWSEDNFGGPEVQPAVYPLIGAMEELLLESNEAQTEEEYMDSLADSFIFLSDNVYRGGYLTELLALGEDTEFSNAYVLGADPEIQFEPELILGKMAQVTLKHKQQIKKYADPVVYKDSMAKLWWCMYFWLDEESGGILALANTVYDKIVSKRNWRVNKETGAAQ